MSVNFDAALNPELEVRETEVFSAICLKSDTAVFAFNGKKQAADAPSKPEAKKEEEAEEDDLFASDSEDEETLKALNEKMAAEKAARKAGKGKGERSLIVLEVKPFEAELDLEVLAKGIKKIEHEGIQNWGLEHKLIPVAFGIKKLQISAVVYDELAGVDVLTDLIESKFGDDVQSVDVFAMSKV